MGVFDGSVIRIRALRKRRYIQATYVDVRYAESDREAKNVVAGLKGARHEPTVAVQVEELHYAVHSRPDLSFGDDWEV